MSLNYDLRKIKNREELQPAALNALIFATMALGINELSEKTLPEWWWRISFLHKIGSGVADRTTEDGIEKWPAKMDDLKPFIGLSSNASNETRTAFVRRMVKAITREVDYAVHQK